GDSSVIIYLQPPGVIPLGGSATICCEYQCDGGTFVLYRTGEKLHTLKPTGRRAEFSISNVTRSFSGPYICYCTHGDNGTVLARSDKLEVLVEELQGPEPVLSILPARDVTAGSAVLFRCTFWNDTALCFLYLEGRPGILYEFPDTEATFHLSHVEQENGGRYICQCFIKQFPPVWSRPSEFLELVVR
ncbi:LIRB5 protein, partial [Eudromia elegans]|nr:LIRB5 protein [Eudromia elegans]